MTTKLSNAVLNAYRTRGYEDGVAGRKPSLNDPVYMVSYRRGVERRVLLQNGGRAEG